MPREPPTQRLHTAYTFAIELNRENRLHTAYTPPTRFSRYPCLSPIQGESLIRSMIGNLIYCLQPTIFLVILGGTTPYLSSVPVTCN